MVTGPCNDIADIQRSRERSVTLSRWVLTTQNPSQDLLWTGFALTQLAHGLFYQHQLSGLSERPRRQPAEIHTAGECTRIPRCAIDPG